MASVIKKSSFQRNVLKKQKINKKLQQINFFLKKKKKGAPAQNANKICTLLYLKVNI